MLMEKYRIKKVIAVTVLLLSLAVMAFTGTRLYIAERINQDSDRSYEHIIQQVRGPARNAVTYPTPPVAQKTAPDLNVQETQAGMEGFPLIGNMSADSAGSGSLASVRERVHVPMLDINFHALKSMNEDAVAWLYLPGSVIDYPVMKADDYSYYLYHLPDGTKNANGSLFIDYATAPDFSERLTVIHGHHMRSGRMFGGLVNYKDQNYYEQNPYMYLYGPDNNYRIDLIYGCVIAMGQWRERAFMYADNLDSFLAFAERGTTFKSNVQAEPGDRFIALSTCSYEFDNARYVVLGVLREAF
ncbi:MAG: class B sortase [Clostridia bacterium]|nr:class B sortase [Clostridia bacterium]